MDQNEINKMVKNSFKEGDADKDWEEETVIDNPAHEPDPANDLPPIEEK